MSGFLLELQGPMMSFADTGFGQLRDTGAFPSRSVVIGIIAAALGVERGSPRLVELHEKLRVHVACYRKGGLLVDYHTILTAGYQDYDATRLRKEGIADANPVLTWRSYQTDAWYAVLIESEDAPLLEEVQEGLRNPVFTTFIGRRSCPPSRPLLPKETEGKSIIEVLNNELQNLRKLDSRPPRQTPKSFSLWLDGEFSDKRIAELAPVLTATVTEYGFRRDLLAAVPRSYLNRPYTHVLLKPTWDEDGVKESGLSFSSIPTTEDFFNDTP